MKLRSIVLSIALLAASIAMPFLNTQPVSALVITASLDDLVRQSDAVIIGTIADVLNSQADNSLQGVHTDVIVRPTRYLYGQAGGNNIAIRLEGGVKGEVGWI